MDIVIDLSFITDFFLLPPDEILRRLFLYFAWIPFAWLFLWAALQLWINYRRDLWTEKNAKFTLLAIDVPRGNEQSPKAVENLFSYLAGAHGSINLIEKYWEGKYQLSFSFEIVSIDGYTQFLIRTPMSFINLVESAVYSQYPDAEITEVDDYTDDYKDIKFPNDEYDIWGGEFVQVSSPALPIKTYEAFEHQMGAPETHFKDPMAALMDLSSSLRKGEQLWYQIILIPTGFDWIKKSDDYVSKILGEKTSSGSNFLNKIADLLLEILRTIGSSMSSNPETISNDPDPLRMMNLKPKQKKQVEGIEAKTTHFAFEFKTRMVYLAKKDVFNKGKVVGGFVGFMKQFSALDMNSFKPDLNYTITSAAYFMAKQRLNQKKNRALKSYIERSTWLGRLPGILNVEELATIWHFPNEAVVKAPLIQKAPGRKAEPPMSLPQADIMAGEDVKKPFLEELVEKDSSSIPDDLFKDEKAPPKNMEKEKSFESSFKEDILDEENDGLGEESSPPSNLPIV